MSIFSALLGNAGAVKQTPDYHQCAGSDREKAGIQVDQLQEHLPVQHRNCRPLRPGSGIEDLDIQRSGTKHQKAVQQVGERV